MSFEQYRSNQDPVLKQVLSFKDQAFIRNPMTHLEQLFNTRQLDKVKSEATRMVKDPLYRFVNFEQELNEKGYQLMNRNQLEPALYVFQLNTELFPQSANAWDSLGEAYWKMKQKDKAVENYQKAVQLDPQGATGDNARKMLSEIMKQ